MQLSASVKTALAILAGLVLYFGARTIFAGAGDSSVDEAAKGPFRVVVETVSPAPWRDEVVVHGRTEALRKVIVRAETTGVVAETPVEPGAIVERGETLCRLKIDARRAALAEARAALAKADLDYDAAVKLAEAGFRAETGVAAAKAARELARASVEQASLAIAKTNIDAPFAGIFDARLAEAGDFLNTGDPCGVLIQQNPFLVVGAVSERDVAKIAKGDRGVARLAEGKTIEGVVRVVATAADEATRTFEVQLEVANDSGALRDGLTASFTVFADRREAYLIARSALSLDDQGRIGVRFVDAGDIVGFAPVALLGEAENGVWVSGLTGAVRVITRGQDFVSPGQKVAVAAVGAAP
jgi:multidrug efflux system membrane fusion protein